MFKSNLNRRNFLKTGIIGTAGASVFNEFSNTINSAVNIESQDTRDITDSFSLRFRQIHLDFHTSEKINKIGEDFDIIEDIIPLYDLKISVKTPKKVRRVIQVPQKKSLKFTRRSNYIEFVLPKLEGHQMIELSF